MLIFKKQKDNSIGSLKRSYLESLDEYEYSEEDFKVKKINS